MKKKLFTLVAILFVFGCAHVRGEEQQQQQQEAPSKPYYSQEYRRSRGPARSGQHGSPPAPTSFNTVWPQPASMSTGNLTALVDLATAPFFIATGYTSDVLNFSMATYYDMMFLYPTEATGVADDCGKHSCSRENSNVRTRKSAPMPQRARIDDGARGSAFASPYSHIKKNQNTEATRTHAASGGLVVRMCTLDVLTPNLGLQAGFDESYSLVIDENGSCGLTSQTAYGMIRALETLAQLVIPTAERTNIIRGLPVTITDTPRYEHRGLLIDTSRHFLPVSLILETIDAMSFNKFNVLHWHVVDDQSFPYESYSFPGLSQAGAYAPSLVYSQGDVKTIISYARLRGIRVIPEFDMPGHSTSWIYGYPFLQGSGDCIMDPTLDSTYQFIEKFLAEVRNVFPESYVHLGGDEVDWVSCWNSSATIRSWAAQHNIPMPQLQAYFEQRVINIISGSITPIFWQEVFQNGAKLSPASIVEVWKGLDYTTLMQVLNSGNRAIMSGGYYLDHLGDTWDVYYTRTMLNQTLTPTQESLFLGGEACMWGESVDYTDLTSRVFPRASAVAESLWSPKTWERVPAKAGPRLHKWRCQMLLRGIEAGPIGVWWNGDNSYCDWTKF